MKKNLVVIAALLVLSVFLAGCTSSAPSAPPSVDMTGNWVGNIQAEAYGETETARFQLQQSGAYVSGKFQVPSGYIYLTLGEFSGRVSGNTVNLTMTLDTAVADPGGGTFSGTVTAGTFSGSGTLRNDKTGDNAAFTFTFFGR